MVGQGERSREHNAELPQVSDTLSAGSKMSTEGLRTFHKECNRQFRPRGFNILTGGESSFLSLQRGAGQEGGRKEKQAPQREPGPHIKCSFQVSSSKLMTFWCARSTHKSSTRLRKLKAV